MGMDITRGLRTSIRYNSSAYGFSALVTTTLAVRQTAVGAPSAFELFLFVAGAGLAFTVLEAAASNFFRVRIRGERSDVVLLGSSLALGSMSLGLAGAWAVSELVGHTVGWMLASFTATVLYVFIAGVEMALAHRAEERHPPTEEEA